VGLPARAGRGILIAEAGLTLACLDHGAAPLQSDGPCVEEERLGSGLVADLPVVALAIVAGCAVPGRGEHGVWVPLLDQPDDFVVGQVEGSIVCRMILVPVLGAV